MPRRTRGLLWPDATDGPWLVLLTWEEIGGRYECVGVEIRSWVSDRVGDVDVAEVDHELALRRTGGGLQPVTASMLRLIPIGSIIETERALTREWYEGMAAAAPSRAEGLMEAAEEWRRPGRPARHDPAEVAEVYTAAWRDSDRGGAPTKAVAEALGISPSAAAKQVARARALGLLPPTQRGRPKGSQPTTDKEE